MVRTLSVTATTRQALSGFQPQNSLEKVSTFLAKSHIWTFLTEHIGCKGTGHLPCFVDIKVLVTEEQLPVTQSPE